LPEDFIKSAVKDFFLNHQQIHAPVFFFPKDILIGIIFLECLFEYWRAVRMCNWLNYNPDDTRLVTAVIVKTREWNMRIDVRVQYQTHDGQIISKSIDNRMPMFSASGFRKGDHVEIAYCQRNPHLIYVADYQTYTLKSSQRATFWRPIWIIILGGAWGFLTYFL